MQPLNLNAMESASILKGGVFALGNFDGVHRGHQHVIQSAINIARRMNAPARIWTMEPHPRAVLRQNTAAFRLTPAAAKLALLQGLGVHDVIVQNFTPDFAALPARDFVERILLSTYGVQHVVAGHDFMFGHNREGTMGFLRESLSAHGVPTTEIPAFTDDDGAIVSSSRIRIALQEGDLSTAHCLLGRRWSIRGVIQHGAQRGRTIGVPTANIALAEHLRPRFGVYAIRAGQAGHPRDFYGVANIGTRPTVDGKTETLEAHLFDFDRDIYGEEWDFELIAFIRPEQTFADLATLQSQIQRDILDAKLRLDALANP